MDKLTETYQRVFWVVTWLWLVDDGAGLLFVRESLASQHLCSYSKRYVIHTRAEQYRARRVMTFR